MPELFKRFGAEFVNENLMGPNPIRIAQELSRHIKLKSGMRILDLGCGKALSSIYLAHEYDVTVFAADLWVNATEIYERVRLKSLEKQIIPIQCDARKMPFADEYFDAIISVNAYHYFGKDEMYLKDILVNFVKTGGYIAVAVPGIKEEFEREIPDDLKEFCAENCFMTFHSHKWWRSLWERTPLVKVVKSFDLECTDDSWDDWLVSNNPAAVGDKHFYDAMHEHFTTSAVIATRK